MPLPDLVLSSRRVVTPEGVRPAAVVIAKGTVQQVAPYPGPTEARELVDSGDAVVMPGLVDTHVHVNEPGRTEWEGFDSATLAAAAGGITTIVDMPLNSSPVTTRTAALRAKAKAAGRRAHVDFGFWGGVIPGNETELAALADAGALGFKCFLVDSGIDEFPPVTEADLDRAMPVLAARDLVLLVHAEAPGPIDAAQSAAGTGRGRRYAEYLRSRPARAEHEAIELMIRLCERHACRVHIVHLASADAVEHIAAAKAAGLPLTVETSPHYLTFAAEEIPDGATTFKCAPPIRERAHRERLWRALGDGRIDLVASDHSPCPLELKRVDSGDFFAARGGIASLQLSLPAVWTGARQRRYPLETLAAWLCERPARLAGLTDRKGSLAPGRDADLVVWDPNASFAVTPEILHHRHTWTPYAGMRLRGVVQQTYLRGRRVYDRGAFASDAEGRWLAGREHD